MNAVQFVHRSDRKEPVASLGAHRQGPKKHINHAMMTAVFPENIGLSVTPEAGENKGS